MNGTQILKKNSITCGGRLTSGGIVAEGCLRHGAHGVRGEAGLDDHLPGPPDERVLQPSDGLLVEARPAPAVVLQMKPSTKYIV